MKITATLIALNEEKNIVDCIVSAQRVCNEVLVVVDSKTTDATARLAEETGARVFHQTYLGDGPQKAFAVPQASYDWILSIDADERLDEDAVAAIESLDLDNRRADAYALRRKNYVGKHWIKAAGFYPDYVIRLYHRERAGYVPKKGHAYVEAKRVERLPAHLIHTTYNDYSHWVSRINELSSRDAWAMYDKGKRPGRLAPVIHALVAFMRKFFIKGGIFQGLDGLTVTLTTVFRTYFKYLKLLEMIEQKARGDK
ncbi:MAG: glycosyltransferase family 2 protein [Gammaproteobacteria bacterium]|nr:glycosyltransferase family 2 protein [Gammaproteobacteria bacterium]MCW8840747.1 glycosyltransferase family 2 protein [Gammaproteobacteria bacterium]MCW8928351.1 glycosyltransferase family 2 protein [Gammaproteobacteria bacterium]MCW8959526.1 glycosyltransferase family 2 protein [Gammaproteobacteria bacterium]MCW8971764.1 glycosyltransferase family 2 protein [Gammaproteobacteria bacterium]